MNPRKLEEMIIRFLPASKVTLTDVGASALSGNSDTPDIPGTSADTQVDTPADTSGGAPTFESVFSFLNIESGLKNCSGDKDFYKEIVFSYANEDKSSRLSELKQKKNWNDYKILVHALKSTSKTIGADELGEKARLLEYAARDKDIAYINQNHEAVMGEYKKLIEKIKEALKND